MRGKKLGIISRAALIFLCAVAVFTGAADALIPDRIALRADDGARLERLLGDSAVSASALSLRDDIYTVECDVKLFDTVPLKRVDVTVAKDIRLIPGGVPFGVKLYSEGVLIVGVGDVMCGGGAVSPARDAGLRERDVIISVGGRRVMGAEEVSELVNSSGGTPIELAIKRDGEELTVAVTPVISDEDGKYRTGLLIRDSTAGIGTVTYIDPECGSFAGLGHGICDIDTGELVPLTRGAVVNVAISGITKGQAGCPGELKGYFSSGKIGTLLGNNDCGVYGVFAEYPQGIGGERVPIALSSEICEGEAELLCTIDGGGTRSYKVDISHIDHSGRSVKNFVVTVTDPVLLDKTGGIVQGMSVCYNRDNTGNNDDIGVFGVCPIFIDKLIGT